MPLPYSTPIFSTTFIQGVDPSKANTERTIVHPRASMEFSPHRTIVKVLFPTHQIRDGSDAREARGFPHDHLENPFREVTA